MRFLFMAGLVLTSCMRPHGDEVKTSDLKPHFSVTQSGANVVCDAWVSLASDPTNSVVTLESDALATCNAQPMVASSGFYSTVLAYVSGANYTINLIRRVDGSTTTLSVRVP